MYYWSSGCYSCISIVGILYVTSSEVFSIKIWLVVHISLRKPRKYPFATVRCVLQVFGSIILEIGYKVVASLLLVFKSVVFILYFISFIIKLYNSGFNQSSPYLKHTATIFYYSGLLLFFMFDIFSLTLFMVSGLVFVASIILSTFSFSCSTPSFNTSSKRCCHLSYVWFSWPFKFPSLSFHCNTWLYYIYDL